MTPCSDCTEAGETCEECATNDNPTPDAENDCFITDQGSRGYGVSFGGKARGWIESMDQAIAIAVNAMRESNYFPNTWYVNDHGNATLLLITIDEHPDVNHHTWTFSDVSYV